MLRHLFNNSEAYPDFILICQGKRWLLHRGFLVGIPYFERLFQDTPDCLEVEIKDHSSLVLENILLSIYSLPRPVLSWQDNIDAYRLADEWHLLAYKQLILKELVVVTQQSSNEQLLNVWQFLLCLDNEEYKNIFLQNLLAEYTLIPPEKELCKEVLSYAQRTKNHIIPFLVHCFQNNTFDKDEINTYLRGIACLEDQHFIIYDLVTFQRELQPSYLDTLIARYFLSLEYLSNRLCPKCKVVITA